MGLSLTPLYVVALLLLLKLEAVGPGHHLDELPHLTRKTNY